MARVSNQFIVTKILVNSNDSKVVSLAPVYNGDPEYNTGLLLANNNERQIDILVPKNSNNFNFFTEGTKYYMDFTAV